MRAFVLEDQKLLREYIAGLLVKNLAITTVDTAGSMAEFWTKREVAESSDLIVFDIDLGDGTPLDWALAQSQRTPPPVLVAISAVSGQFPYKRLQGTSISLLHKGDGEVDIVENIRRALTGAIMVSKRVQEIVATAAADPASPLKLLGPKEVKVLGLLGQRLSNEEVAEAVGTTAQTIADHRKRIMRKLDVHSIEELIDIAIEHGLTLDSQAVETKRLKQHPKGGVAR